MNHLIQDVTLDCRRDGRFFIICIISLSICGAATAANAGTVSGAVTGQPNNDDFTGSFDANPNRHSPGGGRLSLLELVIPAIDSGGTTEYAITISGSYSSDEDPPLTLDYRLQLGFGTGDAFVPAGLITDELDFDTPLPANPEPIIAVFGGVDQHLADTLEIPGASPAGTVGSFFLSRMFRLSVDVPDLPVSVMDFYDATDLPLDFPVGGRAFTLRGFFVPEPQTFWIGLGGTLALVAFIRVR
jgi:hypothetical protein